MNVCDCSSTPYKGLYCNEYYIEEKSTAFMVFLKIISIILTIITIAFIIGIIKNRNDQKIKAGINIYLKKKKKKKKKKIKKNKKKKKKKKIKNQHINYLN